jgi:hypothetical protein
LAAYFAPLTTFYYMLMMQALQHCCLTLLAIVACCGMASAQTITGKVSSASGPLPGVNVLV